MVLAGHPLTRLAQHQILLDRAHMILVLMQLPLIRRTVQIVAGTASPSAAYHISTYFSILRAQRVYQSCNWHSKGN